MRVERADALEPPPVSRLGVAAGVSRGQQTPLRAYDMRRLNPPCVTHGLRPPARASGASPSRRRAERETPG